MTTQNDRALHKVKAWNWQWPGGLGFDTNDALIDLPANCWQTHSQQRGKMHAYTGPSKRTKAKRLAKRLRGKR